MIDVVFLITLLSLPRIGRVKARRIADACEGCHSLQDLLKAIKLVKMKHSNIPDISLETIEDAYEQAQNIIEVSAERNISCISIYEKAYPAILRDTQDPPLVINIAGNMKSLTDLIGVAIIGTRKPSQYGLKAAKRLGVRFGEIGFNVVSGMAAGCDMAAHEGCLNAGGFTTAVLAHGIDTFSSKSTLEFAEKIVLSGGCLVSEYFVGERPIPSNFVERDRIQAGLSRGVVLVESDIDGGSMHAAKSCLEDSRIIACVQPPAEREYTDRFSGNKKLIDKNAAISLNNKNDVLKLIEQLKTYVKKPRHVNCELDFGPSESANSQLAQ